MVSLQRLRMAARALFQLGAVRMAENGLYRIGLRFNAFSIPQPSPNQPVYPLNLDLLPSSPSVQVYWDADEPVALANEIVGGRVRLFGGDESKLDLCPVPPLLPWSDYERGIAKYNPEDVKFVWEPARFTWAVQLLRAYQITHNDEYPQTFWKNLETFLSNNPPYLGPNWTSGQEAAMRIISWSFVLKGFAASPVSTPQRMQDLARAIAVHASRIPPTLIYARSQDNNHLLSEAAGLYTAGLVLPGHPRAAAWRRSGWSWFNRALQRQIEPQGEYIQQSANYHRLMLHLALWVDTLAKRSGDSWPGDSLERLRAATEWLRQRLDPVSGRVANFGHNDGANLFPFGEYADFRSAVQAAGAAFFGQATPAHGGWDELGERLELRVVNSASTPSNGGQKPLPGKTHHDATGAILREEHTWSGLRAGPIHRRPGQADQLHVDVWWRGHPVLLDAGTYRYTAEAPWDNGLASAFVHNSVTIDDQEPMTRAGRFLWLDWDQARIETCVPGQMVAERSGYRKLGVRHRRSVQWVEKSLWKVSDDFSPATRNSRPHRFTLHWLFPDCSYQMNGNEIILTLPQGRVRVNIEYSAPDQPDLHLQLIRAGELLSGDGKYPQVLGWWSPTYNRKLPALSLRASIYGRLPARLITLFALDRPPLSR